MEPTTAEYLLSMAIGGGAAALAIALILSLT